MQIRNVLSLFAFTALGMQSPVFAEAAFMGLGDLEGGPARGSDSLIGSNLTES